MRIFPASQIQQTSPDWWDIRRGIPTASEFDRILSPKKLKTGGQVRYLADLLADVAFEDRPGVHYWSERLTKPPNTAVKNGVKREAESRAWLAMERECHVELVGFVLDDSGMYGCSPDGLIISDSGCLDGTLECKNPQPNTQARRLISGDLPSEYVNQCHGHLIVTGLARCTFLSYCPPFDPLLLDVRATEYTCRLKEELQLFVKKYLDALTKLRLLARFEQQRKSVLAHFEESRP